MTINVAVRAFKKEKSIMTRQFPTFVDPNLGLPTDEAAIGEFIAAHSPLPRGVDELCEASFCTPSRAALLRDEFMHDARCYAAQDSVGQ